MYQRIEMTGRRYGRLIVLKFHSVDRGGNAAWLCRCECGNRKVIAGGNLRNGTILSCGCLRHELTVMLKLKHGYRKNGQWIPEYIIWSGMWKRCTNPKTERWPRYGGRGIKVCKRWRSFANFLADMGKRPSPKHSIDRINNNGNYTPSNCRWATRKMQRRNQR